MDKVSYGKVIGLDIHQGLIVGCSIWTEDGELRTEKATFKAFSNDLRQMAIWCASFAPDLVIMESTGIFWKSPYAHLEKVGIQAAVVNARQIHQMEGKKTDMADAEWLAFVGRLGMFSRSFIPSTEYQNLRIPSRNLLKITNQLASVKNRFSKVFSDAGYRLNLVFSNISGVNAKRVTDALIEGTPPDKILITLDLNRLKASSEELRAAFDGELSEEHRFTLKDLRDDIDYLEQKAEKYRIHLIEKIKEIDEQGFDLLQTIPGINEISAAQILIELGGSEHSSFKTAEKLASWIGVCPGNNESAGKRKHGHTMKGNIYIRRILCECANAAVKTKNTTLESKYKSLRVRIGTKRSLVAIVHKIVKLIFIVIKKKEGYRDPKIDYDELNVIKNGKRWMKKLIECGRWKIEAINKETGECFSNL